MRGRGSMREESPMRVTRYNGYEGASGFALRRATEEAASSSVDQSRGRLEASIATLQERLDGLQGTVQAQQQSHLEQELMRRNRVRVRERQRLSGRPMRGTSSVDVRLSPDRTSPLRYTALQERPKSPLLASVLSEDQDEVSRLRRQVEAERATQTALRAQVATYAPLVREQERMTSANARLQHALENERQLRKHQSDRMLREIQDLVAELQRTRALHAAADERLRTVEHERDVAVAEGAAQHARLLADAQSLAAQLEHSRSAHREEVSALNAQCLRMSTLIDSQQSTLGSGAGEYIRVIKGLEQALAEKRVEMEALKASPAFWTTEAPAGGLAAAAAHAQEMEAMRAELAEARTEVTRSRIALQAEKRRCAEALIRVGVLEARLANRPPSPAPPVPPPGASQGMEGVVAAPVDLAVCDEIESEAAFESSSSFGTVNTATESDGESYPDGESDGESYPDGESDGESYADGESDGSASPEDYERVEKVLQLLNHSPEFTVEVEEVATVLYHLGAAEDVEEEALALTAARKDGTVDMETLGMLLLPFVVRGDPCVDALEASLLARASASDVASGSEAHASASDTASGSEAHASGSDTASGSEADASASDVASGSEPSSDHVSHILSGLDHVSSVDSDASHSVSSVDLHELAETLVGEHEAMSSDTSTSSAGSDAPDAGASPEEVDRKVDSLMALFAQYIPGARHNAMTPDHVAALVLLTGVTSEEEKAAEIMRDAIGDVDAVTMPLLRDLVAHVAHTGGVPIATIVQRARYGLPVMYTYD